MPHPRYAKEEIVRRGKEWYEREIRSKVEEGNEGKALVIDIETGHYELDEDGRLAARRALERHPGAALYLMRIGYPAYAKIGGGWGTATSTKVSWSGMGRIGPSLFTVSTGVHW
jgi:hypothetical protein